MTKQQEKMVEVENLIGDVENQSKMIELIFDKLIDVHSTVGLDGMNIPSDKQRRARLGKDVLNCMSALEGVNKALSRAVENLNQVTGDIELLLLKEAK